MELPSHTATSDAAVPQVETLIADLSAIRADMLTLEERLAAEVAAAHELQRESARNLLHYLALRSHDIREVQRRLAPLGLSSLGRAEAHALASLDGVSGLLHLLAGHPSAPPVEGRLPLTFARGKAALERQTIALFKARPRERRVRIMVTMPSSAATDYALVRDLLAQGMDVMRINCAHDTPAAWEAMVRNLRRAEQELGLRGQVMMDIAGPKLRTGSLAPGPQVVKWRPERDALGHVVRPARVWLTSADAPQPAPAPCRACLPVEASWLAALAVGETLTLRDARSKRRNLQVTEAVGPHRWAESGRTAYITPGTMLRRTLRRGRRRSGPATTRLGALPPTAQPILLRRGDTLLVTDEAIPGAPALLDPRGRVIAPAHIGCTAPAVFADLRPGERLLLDDGTIGGVIRRVAAEQIEVEVTDVRMKGARLGADKGINLPDSTLHLPALTEQDIAALPFVVAHAELVGYSFVRGPQDVLALQAQLARVGGEHLGVVVKIETRAAVDALPAILLAAMRSSACGVMIARGDLAVECGYERLAELQEEILCIAESAHAPVIWATQVLEHLAQDGVPSRAEISDVAMGERAECVMLNKGPFITEAVRVLDDILRRMQDHQSKRSARLRSLHLARRVWSETP